ncbi:MAG: diguanylate cyclase [Hylemonella sp.]|nr:diguanylate cyclase [Hylemonella sp.]
MFTDNNLLAKLPGLAPERKPRLLLVDDQAINIQVMHRAFAQDCQVFMATSGPQALQICQDQAPDLVLLDIEMPEMDGFEVCRRLKASDLTRHIPVIFVTAHTDPAQETRGLELGAVDFISKPVNPSVLRARVRTHLMLKFQSDVLRDLVFLDGLTTLHNRRYFDQQLELEWARSVRQDTALSLILVDVDYFKRYNDHYGHQAGDDCLREIAALLKTSFKRGTDIVARYGGEEFVCLLPDTGHEDAMRLAEEIAKRVRERALPHAKSDVAAAVTVSLGVASGNGLQGAAKDLLALADQQLYLAKSSGRARACGAVLGKN